MSSYALLSGLIMMYPAAVYQGCIPVDRSLSVGITPRGAGWYEVTDSLSPPLPRSWTRPRVSAACSRVKLAGQLDCVTGTQTDSPRCTTHSNPMQFTLRLCSPRGYSVSHSTQLNSRGPHPSHRTTTHTTFSSWELVQLTPTLRLREIEQLQLKYRQKH